MRRHTKATTQNELINQLKNLPEEDRVFLGLFLYEGLSSDEISAILNARSTELPVKRKSILKSRINTF